MNLKKIEHSYISVAERVVEAKLGGDYNEYDAKSD